MISSEAFGLKGKGESRRKLRGWMSSEGCQTKEGG